MEFTQADKDAITTAWMRIVNGETDFMHGGSDTMGIEAANSVLFVVVHDVHNSEVVKEVLDFAQTLGNAQQMLGGVFTTTISVSPR